LGKCTVEAPDCAWSTCHDDNAFIENLLEHVAERICVDMDSVSIIGFSNGGMLSFELAGTTLAGKITAVLPQYALPLLDGLKVPDELFGTSFLYLGGRSDTLIPPDGILEGFPWYYDNYTHCLAAYAKVNGCDATSVVAKTPVDGQDGMECIEHPNCASGKRMCTIHREV
jgi:poly(3-hydroxybutyrate) depolymerase